jgi:hypothetical protein
MPDPRNVAHDKKVMEEKKHEGEDLGEGTVNDPQPGKKPPMEKHASDEPPINESGEDVNKE